MGHRRIEESIGERICSLVVSDVPPFIVFALTPLWSTAGFLLHFKEGIHVIGKESSSFRFRIVLFRFIKMPHFVDTLNYISFLSCAVDRGFDQRSDQTKQYNAMQNPSTKKTVHTCITSENEIS
jgi:hypothetical protein